MRVLIALDESKHSDLALDSVKARYWPQDTKFLLCTVVENFAAAASVCSEQVLKKAQDEIQAVASNLLHEKAADLLRALPGSDVSIVIETGKASDRIVALAFDWDADLIVLGSHGRRGVQRYALGSVCESVVDRAPCSVEIIKFPKAGGKAFLNQKRVLVCYDISRNSDAALRWMADGEWSPEQEFVLISILAPLEDVLPAQFTKKLKKVKSEIFDETQRMLNLRCSFLRRSLKNTKVEAVILEGYAAESIIEFADKWDADLVILGAHSEEAKGASPLDSVARKVVANAHCFVKVVRDKVQIVDHGSDSNEAGLDERLLQSPA